MSKFIIIRISLLLSLLIGVWFLPWWATLIAALTGLIFIPHFYELILPALLFDLLYSVPLMTHPSLLRLPLTALALLFVLLVDELRPRILLRS